MAKHIMNDTEPAWDALSKKIFAYAARVHQNMGSGYSEATYAMCLILEFKKNGMPYKNIEPMFVNYQGERIACGSWINFLVNEQVLVELKSTTQFLPIDEIQLLASMKAANATVGLFINFSANSIDDGVKRFTMPTTEQTHSELFKAKRLTKITQDEDTK